MHEDGHQNQIAQGHGDQEVARQGLAGGIELIAGAGKIDADAGWHQTVGLQRLDDVGAHGFHGGFQRHRTRRHDVERDRAPTIDPAQGFRVHGFHDLDQRPQRQHRPAGRVDRQIGHRGQRLRAAGGAIEVDIDLVVVEEELVDKGAVAQGCHREPQPLRTHAEFGHSVPVGTQLQQRLAQHQIRG